jgi:two-component system sensor histidine kinase/response regulator
VMMTSVGKRGDASRFEKAGFTAYLTKPIKRAQLHDCLVMVLERAESVEHPCGAIITRHSVVEGRKGEVRILLAEDNLTNRMVALKILEKLGYTADAVGNGLEVLDAVQALPYDLVLMDVQMPEMDGFEATQKIRNLESTASNRDLPIIAMTAHAMKGDRERCLEAGMSDYVTKPIRPRELGEAIARWTSPGKRINRDRRVEKRTDPTEVFDRAGLLDRLSGDEEMLQELMETFLDDIPRQIGTLEEAIEKGNALDARLHAHTLKGTSANFGAQTLQAAAYWVEKAAEGGSLSKALEGMERIKAEFDTFRQVVAPVNRSK